MYILHSVTKSRPHDCTTTARRLRSTAR